MVQSSCDGSGQSDGTEARAFGSRVFSSPTSQRTRAARMAPHPCLAATQLGVMVLFELGGHRHHEVAMGRLHRPNHVVTSPITAWVSAPSPGGGGRRAGSGGAAEHLREPDTVAAALRRNSVSTRSRTKSHPAPAIRAPVAMRFVDGRESAVLNGPVGAATRHRPSPWPPRLPAWLHRSAWSTTDHHRLGGRDGCCSRRRRTLETATRWLREDDARVRSNRSELSPVS
jgi:hypothetical protein